MTNSQDVFLSSVRNLAPGTISATGVKATMINVSTAAGTNININGGTYTLQYASNAGTITVDGNANIKVFGGQNSGTITVNSGTVDIQMGCPGNTGTITLGASVTGTIKYTSGCEGTIKGASNANPPSTVTVTEKAFVDDGGWEGSTSSNSSSSEGSTSSNSSSSSSSSSNDDDDELDTGHTNSFYRVNLFASILCMVSWLLLVH